MDIKAMQQEVMKTCHRHRWLLNPYKDLGLLTEEVGELAIEVRRVEDKEEGHDEAEDKEVLIAHLTEEMGDILFPLIKIAGYYGVTLEEALQNHLNQQGSLLNPYKDLGLLTENVGKLAREVRRIEDGRERPDEVEPDKAIMIAQLTEKMGDILFALIEIANYYGITLKEAFQSHQAKMAERYEKENNEMFETEEK